MKNEGKNLTGLSQLFFLFSICFLTLLFFSGHSSISLAAATYFCFYTQDRLAGQVNSRVLVPVLQTLELSISFFVAYTRIMDNWHHWSDVMAGCLVGAVATGLLVSFLKEVNAHLF